MFFDSCILLSCYCRKAVHMFDDAGLNFLAYFLSIDHVYDEFKVGPEFQGSMFETPPKLWFRFEFDVVRKKWSDGFWCLRTIFIIS